MKRILVIRNSVAGLYNFNFDLIEHLVSLGYEIFIAIPHGDRITDFEEIGCKCIRLELDRHGTNPLKELPLVRAYKKICKEINPDIVLTYTIKPNIYGGIVCRSLKIPYIPNITGLGTSVENSGILRELLIFMYRYALGKVSTVLFQNIENMKFFEKHRIAPGKHRLLPGSGVNLNKFSIMEYPPDRVVQFAFVGRVMKEKGIEQYLEAARVIRSKYSNIVFHICGSFEQDYSEEINKLHDSGIVNYHGVVSDIRVVLKDIHCLVHPTYYPEGMSNVLLEACASARPIITTNRAGCREIMEDGVNGYFVREKDSQDLVNKMEKFMALPHKQKKQMGIAGRKKVEKEFDRQIVVDAYLEEINRIRNVTNPVRVI